MPARSSGSRPSKTHQPPPLGVSRLIDEPVVSADDVEAQLADLAFHHRRGDVVIV